MASRSNGIAQHTPQYDHSSDMAAHDAQGLEAELLAAFGSMTQPPKSDPESSQTEALPPSEPAPAADLVAFPKRARTPDDDGEARSKRPKTEHDIGDWDMEAMIQNALGSFDEQFNQEVVTAAEETLGRAVAEVSSENHFATAAASPADKAEEKIMKASSNSLYVMRVMSLPVLGNLAVQILLRLSQQPRAETETLLGDAESEFARSYQILGDMFVPARKVFLDGSPLLNADELDITDSEDRETIRMANLATTSASVFGKNDVLLQDIHDSFLAIFVPEDSSFNEPLADLFVSFKTQAFLKDTAGHDRGTQHFSDAVEKYFSLTSAEEVSRQRNGDDVGDGEGDASFSQVDEALAARTKARRELLLSLGGEEAQKRAS